MEKEKNKNSFTILEMLFVIIVVTSISTMSLVGVNRFNQKQMLNQAVKQFGADFNMIQSESITNACNSHIEIKEVEYIVYVCDELTKTQVIQKGITATTKFTSNISVNKNGNLRFGAGRVVFTSRNFEKQIIFSIGEGRYRIE